MLHKPISFKKGSVFSHALKLNLPQGWPENYFKTWRISAQLRTERSGTHKPPIADLFVKWANDKHTAFIVYHDLTDNWPLGNADLDILLTSTGGQEIRTRTVPFVIKQEVTND